MTQATKQITLSIAIVGLFLAFFLALPSDSHAMVLGKERMTANASSTKPETRASSTKPETRASSTKPVGQVKNLSCVQEAVLERETNIMTAWTTFNTAMVASLTKRTDALVAAWKMTTVKERTAALKTLWTTWKDDSKKAHSEMKNDRKEAWTEFKKTMKEECKEARLPKEDSEPRDASGAATI